MGMLYELLSTPVAYALPAHYDHHPPRRGHSPVTIPFGPHRLQHCVLWEPAEITHETVVMYFHGGGYLVGTPEPMRNAADVYNSQGYHFVSVGFRLMPHDRFPAQVDDAFASIAAACEWLLAHGRPCKRVVVSGSSCGGHLTYLVAYSEKLQRDHGFEPSMLAGVVSVAGVADKMSPYQRNADLARLLDDQAMLFTIGSWWWQHMILTVTLHKHGVRCTPALAALFRWLDELDAPNGAAPRE